MTGYIGRRLLEGLVTLIALSFVVFGSVHLSGDPARFLLPISAEHDESVYLEQRARLGLDKPFIVQYWSFLSKAVFLDFGNSFTERRPVQQILAERIPATVHLALAGMVLAVGIGVPLGIISAVKRDTLLDRCCKAFAIFGMAVPQFWIAIMLIILLAGYWGWLPAYGRGDTQGWLPEWSQIPNMIRHLILPASVLALAIIAAIMRLAQTRRPQRADSGDNLRRYQPGRSAQWLGGCGGGVRLARRRVDAAGWRAIQQLSASSRGDYGLRSGVHSDGAGGGHSLWLCRPARATELTGPGGRFWLLTMPHWS